MPINTNAPLERGTCSNANNTDQIVSHEAAKNKLLLDSLGRKHTFQTFDDSPKKRPHLVKILHGTLEENKKELQRLNSQGAGIYFTVNQTDLSGRTAKNVTRVRALFVDFDTVDLNRTFNYYLPPSAIVESSPGKHHVYWFVDGLDLSEFKEYQLKLAHALGGDLKVHDLPRVMRVPGFDHKKGEPFPALEIGGYGATYTAVDLRDWVDSLSDLIGDTAISPPLHTEDDPDAVKMFEFLLAKLSNQEEGGRNDALNKTAFTAYGLCAAGRLEYDDVTSQLIDTAVEM